MARILVLCAMEDERPAANLFHPYETEVRVSGVGKLNAALAVASWSKEHCQSGGIVIVVGSAGSLDPKLKPGTFVISTDARQHDVDASALGFTKSDVPFASQQLFDATSSLVRQAETVINGEKVAFSKGRYLSGDCFIAKKRQATDLHRRLGGACVDFETAAVAQACQAFCHSWIAIKFITDGANEQSPSDFQANLKRYRQASGRIVQELIRHILAPKEKKRSRRPCRSCDPGLAAEKAQKRFDRQTPLIRHYSQERQLATGWVPGRRFLSAQLHENVVGTAIHLHWDLPNTCRNRKCDSRRR